MVPDSKISPTSGAWLRRARLAAALGRPMPTKQTMLLCSWRAAAMVMISSAVYPRSRTALLLRCGFQARLELGEIPGSHHMPGHPCEKRLALAGDIVPRLVE